MKFITKFFIFVLLGLGLVLTSCQSKIKQTGSEESSVILTDLKDLEELRIMFNQNKGSPRLLLLLSPTCSVCIVGARFVEKEILKKYPLSNLKVYVVWFNVLPTDHKSKWDAELMSDPRVIHLWDEEKIVSEWFKKNGAFNYGSIAWDVYYLYGSDAGWQDSLPSPLISSGYPVIRKSKELKKNILLLLEN